MRLSSRRSAVSIARRRRTLSVGSRAQKRARASPRRVGPRSPAPGPRRPFAILAPGKLEREVAQHTFWRGSLWGRTVALQGDSSFTKFDLFEVAGSQLLYWGTFRGNGYYDSEETHSFSAPFAWMDQWMKVGDFKQQRITDSTFDPRLRRVVNSGDLTLRVEIVAHHDAWRDPDSQITYKDVLEVHYWGRYPEAASREIYHLGHGLGTTRFETFNRQEPSGVHYQFAEYFERCNPARTLSFTAVGYGNGEKFPIPGQETGPANPNGSNADKFLIRYIAEGMTYNAHNPVNDVLRLSMNIAKGENGTCNGDSGGPVFYQDPSLGRVQVSLVSGADVVCRATNTGPGFSTQTAHDFLACASVEGDVSAVRACVEGLFGQ